jgi:hypothetical protein
MSEAIYTYSDLLGRSWSNALLFDLFDHLRLRFHFWSNVVELVPVRPVRPHTTSTGACLFHSELRRFPFVSWLIFLLVTLGLCWQRGCWRCLEQGVSHVW